MSLESWERGAPTADGAIADLYAAHWRPLVRLAWLMVHDQLLAEDIVQEAFVATHRAWGRHVSRLTRHFRTSRTTGGAPLSNNDIHHTEHEDIERRLGDALRTEASRLQPGDRLDAIRAATVDQPTGRRWLAPLAAAGSAGSTPTRGRASRCARSR